VGMKCRSLSAVCSIHSDICPTRCFMFISRRTIHHHNHLGLSMN
jgi:hypothetical protein